MHIRIVSTKVRDVFRLEHQIHRASTTAKGLGEHTQKDGQKASITISQSSAMESGYFGRTSHGCWFGDTGLLNGESCDLQVGGVLNW